MRGSGSPLPLTTPCVRVSANSAPTPLSLSLISSTCAVEGKTSTIFPTTPSGVITAMLRRTWSRSPRLMKSVCELGSALAPITCAAIIGRFRMRLAEIQQLAQALRFGRLAFELSVAQLQLASSARRCSILRAGVVQTDVAGPDTADARRISRFRRAPPASSFRRPNSGSAARRGRA